MIVVLALGLGLGLGLRNSQVATTKRGAVTSVARECAQIGTYVKLIQNIIYLYTSICYNLYIIHFYSDILKMDGSAADAAIATLFCDGAATMQSMGLGGGFLMTIYTKETGKAESLDAREAAPAAAHKDMFENITIVTGPLSIAIPAELKGYGALYNRYGRLPWRTLIQPTINLCRNGFELSAVLDRVIHLPTYDVMIKTNPEYRDIFVNPQTGELYVKGDIIRRPKLAATLELIAEEGPATLYTANGTMANLLIDEIQNLGGILTIQDLVDYSVQWQDSNTARVFNDKRIYSSPLPGSGSVLIFIMNLLDGFLPNEESVTFFHRMIESFKFGFAMRTKLGDPIFEPTAAEVSGISILLDLNFNYINKSVNKCNKYKYNSRVHVTILCLHVQKLNYYVTQYRDWHMTVATFLESVDRMYSVYDFVLQFVKKLTDPQYATEIRAQILENQTSQNYTYYGADYSNVEDHGTAHISVLAPNGDAVSITSTVNT